MSTVSIDVDVVAHLGFLRNINLLQTGIYNIQLGLCYADITSAITNTTVNGSQPVDTTAIQRITPTGLFSCPSTLGSFIFGTSVRIVFFKFVY